MQSFAFEIWKFRAVCRYLSLSLALFQTNGYIIERHFWTFQSLWKLLYHTQAFVAKRPHTCRGVNFWNWAWEIWPALYTAHERWGLRIYSIYIWGVGTVREMTKVCGTQQVNERGMVVMLHFEFNRWFYFFFKVKNDRFLGSSLLSIPAGRVWDFEPEGSGSCCTAWLMELTQATISSW